MRSNERNTTLGVTSDKKSFPRVKGMQLQGDSKNISAYKSNSMRQKKNLTEPKKSTK